MRGLGGLLVLATALGAFGCGSLPGAKTPPPYLACSSAVPDYHYDDYKALCDAGRHAEEAASDVLAVTAYADRLLAVSESLRVSIDDAEWQARTGRASELLGGVVGQLTAGDVAKAHLARGVLEIHAYGYKDPRPERSFLAALDAGGGWDAGATLVSFYAQRTFPGPAGIDACQRTYEAGVAAKREYQDLRQLVDTCKGLVIGAKDPKNPYTSIEPEYWDELRTLAAAK